MDDNGLDYRLVPAYQLSIGDTISWEFDDVEITDIALGNDDKIMIEFFKGDKQVLINTLQFVEYFRSTNG